MYKNTFNTIRLLYVFAQINYYASLLILISTTAMVLTGNDNLFQADVMLYGPIANNLKVLLFYLAVIDIALAAFCYIRYQYIEVIILGTFFILMIGSLEFYSNINHIPLDSGYRLFFFYIGVSHIIFGIVHQVVNGEFMK